MRSWRRFSQNRGTYGMRREKQLLIDFLCASAGGPLYYTGRDMALSHKGMKISASDWAVLFWQERRRISRASRAPMKKRAPITSYTICVSATAIGRSRSIFWEKKCCRRYESSA
jgi:hemoglobin